MIAVALLLPASASLALLLPLLLLALQQLRRQNEQQVAVALGARQQQLLGQPCFGRSRALALAAALLFAALALLQPVAGAAASERRAADVVLCLDISRSMQARDQQPDRLTVAQADIASLAAAAAGARLGLVLFAGTAELAVPLSPDLAAVAELAQSANASRLLRGGSDPGAAIDLALATLQRAGSRAGAIVLLSDGEDFVGAGPAAAARARAGGYTVHCLGYGRTAGSKIVVDSEQGEVYLRDANGVEVITALLPQQLAAVAAAGGGRQLAGGDNLLPLYRQVLQPQAELAAVLSGELQPIHLHPWCLLLSLGGCMLFLALPSRRIRR